MHSLGSKGGEIPRQPGQGGAGVSHWMYRNSRCRPQHHRPERKQETQHPADTGGDADGWHPVSWSRSAIVVTMGSLAAGAIFEAPLFAERVMEGSGDRFGSR